MALLLAEASRVISWVNIVLSPSADSIGHRQDPVGQNSSILSTLVTLLHMRQHKHSDTLMIKELTA
jgi:hypothetical protein